MTRNGVLAGASLFGLVWLGILLWQDVPVEGWWLRWVPTAVSVVMLLFWPVERWLWKYWPLNGLLWKRPFLGGTWRVTLQTSWKNPETGETPGPITCYMAVRQTLTTLSMRLMTPESRSLLVADRVLEESDGVFQVMAVYRNEPKIELRGERSEIHYGAFRLEIRGTPPSGLRGEYWTDRVTRGTMDFDSRVPKVLDTYEEAAQTFRGP